MTRVGFSRANVRVGSIASVRPSLLQVCYAPAAAIGPTA
jgi:hypothetical protein